MSEILTTTNAYKDDQQKRKPESPPRKIRPAQDDCA